MTSVLQASAKPPAIKLIYCGSGGASKFDLIAQEEGWNLGIRSCGRYKPMPGQNIYFVDIDWKNYDHGRHLACCKVVQPHLASARDIESLDELPRILREAEEISHYAKKVLLIPKIPVKIPTVDFNYILGYSVPTTYGATPLGLDYFADSPIHLLGGSISQQARILEKGLVVSLDNNQFALVAKWGKSTWPGAVPQYQQIEKGCYQAFRASLKRSKEWFSEAHIQIPTDVDAD